MPTQNDAVRELAEQASGMICAKDWSESWGENKHTQLTNVLERIIRNAIRPLLAQVDDVLEKGRTANGCDSFHMNLREERERWKEQGT